MLKLLRGALAALIAIAAIAVYEDARAQDQGAPVDDVWDGALAQYDIWSIPKNAANYDNAVKFIDYVSRAAGRT